MSIPQHQGLRIKVFAIGSMRAFADAWIFNIGAPGSLMGWSSSFDMLESSTTAFEVMALPEDRAARLEKSVRLGTSPEGAQSLA
ncbi:hypothetical protein NliqN6_3369 [Naganishia liquefaciens]|uniref:Uncharacterized protein n=1 Tax=Naganishia liquefaciens TaxID=104408 RepID=A0A8H3YG81_9TREE|nr:hypothetical protein NliqN6_3369 [Naganishia liquefaciens]